MPTKSRAGPAVIRLTSGLILVVCLAFSAQARGTEVSLPEGREIYLQTEVFGGLLNDMPGFSSIAAGFGYAGRAGWRSGKWGVFAGFERDFWITNNWELKVVGGVLNLGIGGEFLYFDERVRTSVTVGSSSLMFDTVFDEKGTTGIFVDVRPAGLRWAVLDWLILEFCPISFSLMAPVLGDRPLKKLEYRSYLTVEVPL